MTTPSNLNGALLINKHAGLTSFGIVHEIKKKISNFYGLPFRKLPKVGHGGTLDPFATGLLVVLIGKGSKLADYFLGSKKSYSGTIEFGKTTATGDLTADKVEICESFPLSLDEIQNAATKFSCSAYQQIPPMFSAKKHKGKPLYRWARKGVEIKREPKLCHLYHFEIQNYQKPYAKFQLDCSSGTYVRTLAQDLAIEMNTLGVLSQLERTASGHFNLKNALSLSQINEMLEKNQGIHQLPNWISFDDLLEGYSKIEATSAEAQQLSQGQKEVFQHLLDRSQPAESILSITHQGKLIGVAKRKNQKWKLERTFPHSLLPDQ